MFQSFESCIFQFSPPENRALLQQVSQRPADNAKVMDKLVVVACLPEETPHFLEITWCRPRLNCLDILWVSAYAITADFMTQVSQRRLEKLAFAAFHSELVMGQDVKHLTE
jgi:hypothetical protein